MSQSVRTSKGMIFLKLNLLFEYQNLNRMKSKNQGTFILILHISYMFRDILVGSARHVIEDYEFEARWQPYFAVYPNYLVHAKSVFNSKSSRLELPSSGLPNQTARIGNRVQITCLRSPVFLEALAIPFHGMCHALFHANENFINIFLLRKMICNKLRKKIFLNIV